MTIWTPGWMQGGTYTAQQDRINSRAADWDEGVQNRRAFKVTQRAAGANLTVDVAAGAAVVTGDDQAFQGNYDVFSDAVGSVAGFAATSANTRYDLVGIQINDPNAGGAAGSNAVLTRVAGTQAASPVIPAIPNSFLPIAIVGPFTTSTTSITNAMIHDAHTGTGPAGVTGVRLVAGFRAAPGTTQESWNPVPPNGWLVEDGSAKSRTTYADLFEHIGTIFGAGDGSTTFNLPNSRGRVFVALDNQGGTDAGVLTAANTLGGSGGEELHALTSGELVAHTHSTPAHKHVVNPPQTDLLRFSVGGANVTVGASSYRPILDGLSGDPLQVDIAAFDSATDGAGTSGSTGIGTPFNVMQPYILGYRFIRT